MQVSQPSPPYYKRGTGCQREEYKATFVFLSHAWMPLQELKYHLCFHSRCASHSLCFSRCATFPKGTFELRFPTHKTMFRWIYSFRETMKGKKRPGSKHFSDQGLSFFRKAHSHGRTMRVNTTNIYKVHG